MAFKLNSRVRETSTTIGTGAYALGGAVTGRRAASAVMANGDQEFWLSEMGADWEIFLGTWNTGNTLSRTTIYKSTNGDAAVNWGAGVKRLAVIDIAPSDLPAAGLALFRTLLGLGSIYKPSGRLTLTTALSITVADVTAAATVYFTPHLGNHIPIYDGTNWVPTTFAELSLALDSDSGHAGYHQSGKNFDLFVINDAGTIRLGTGPAWTSDTARGTGAGTTQLSRSSGMIYNTVAITIRFGSASGNTVSVAAGSATYVGTMRASANGQTEDSVTKRFLWNMYNRAPRQLKKYDTTDSWTWSTNSYQQANANAANQVEFVRGLDEDVARLTARHFVISSGATARIVVVAIGLGSASANAADCMPGRFSATSTNAGHLTATYEGFPGLGYRYLTWLEAGGGADTQTWYGDFAAAIGVQNGLLGSVMA